MKPERRHAVTPGAMVGSLIRHRSLILQMTVREVVGRYRGSIMGLTWSFLHPLLMLTVYTLVFGVVFKARWGGGDSKLDFALILFAGMIVHGLFAECANRAPGLVLANPNFVKKVVFPLEILPWVTMGSALFHAALSLIVLLAFFAAFKLFLHPTVFLLPLVILPFVLLTMGVSWLLASLGVYARDVGQVIGVVTTLLLFLSPVFYPVSALPEGYRIFIQLNPLTFIIEQTREVVIWGRLPDWAGLVAYAAAGSVAAWLGFAWFQHTRRGFADVL